MKVCRTCEFAVPGCFSACSKCDRPLDKGFFVKLYPKNDAEAFLIQLCSKSDITRSALKKMFVGRNMTNFRFQQMERVFSEKGWLSYERRGPIKQQYVRVSAMAVEAYLEILRRQGERFERRFRDYLAWLRPRTLESPEPKIVAPAVDQDFASIFQ